MKLTVRKANPIAKTGASPVKVSGAPLQPLHPFDPLRGVNPLTARRTSQDRS